ncbi:MAG: DUF1653 domain-containing protein [Lachnospiraceae bacterium]
MKRTVHPGEFYRHFKNKLYQIITVAIHSETGEPMVVYQALYGDFQTYVRPLAMFLEKVDRDKYPDAEQIWRFECVVLVRQAEPETEISQEPEVNPLLLQFLDAETLEEKIGCLDLLEKGASQKELDSIYVVLDIRPETGTVTEQIGAVRRYLNMQKHYDGGHLR